MKLRDYQANAVAAVHEQLEQVRSTLVVMPTGCGKTVLFSKVADERTRGRVMVVAHREELIRQAALKITAVTGEHVEIEMADERADQFGLLGRSRFVVASVQTLSREKRLKRFNPDDFGTLIIDEAHHAVAASYKVIIDHFTQNPDLRILGVTATPDRADEIALGKIFESVAFNYEILDAINDGWLVPITSRTVKVEGLDFSHIRTTAGDLNGKELAELLEQEKLLHEVAGPTLELARARKVLVFASSVKQAERLAEIFNRHRPDCARWVCGKTDREVRAQVLRDYSARPMRFQFLVNVGVFTEGFDEPCIDMIVMARPTKSRALYAQAVGRGTRPLPGVVDGLATPEERRAAIARSRKPNVEILDFEGNAGQHKLICPADILGGRYEDAVVHRATRNAAKAGRAVNIADELKKAEQEIKDERAKAKRANITARAEYTTQTVDPFDILDIEPRRERGWDTSKGPSEPMLRTLERGGVEIVERGGKKYVGDRELTRALAGQLCGEIIQRWNKRLCSIKQAKVLKKYGYPTDMTFDEARRTLDRLAANGWRRPADEPVEVGA